jgi:murein tripeptide amidase MpaA
VRGSENIVYYQNGIRRPKGGDKGQNYYTLTFTIEFEHDADMVYFCHCYPYTYTDLQRDMQALEADPAVVKNFRRRKLCDTLAGNACDLVTITSFNSDPESLRSRRAVVITARVHPGESNASWIMKGILDYLTGTSLDARILRDNFVFKIVPMLNPDGVIVGNYRCSLAGTDLNRQWAEPSRRLHPTIFFYKEHDQAPHV